VFEKTKMNLTKGKKYRVRIEYYQNMGAAIAKFQWGREHEDYTPKIDNIIKQSDVVVYVGGITPWLEGEDMPVNVEGFKGGDRTTLDLPKVQERILKKIKAYEKPIILVMLNGSPLSVNWANENVNAILEGWYPGEEGGNAIADVILGNYNPAGRLPVTFYASVNDLPPFEDYSMKGRTYRYFNGTPLYEFGYGLSYTDFKYSDLRVPKKVKTNENIKVTVGVMNIGTMDGDEVIELYVKILDAKVPVPNYALQGFKRIFLNIGEKKSVEFELKPEQLSVINDQNQRVVEPGKIQLYVGGRQPSQKALSSGNVLKTELEVSGEVNLIE
jgi:beta-glucosidase